MCIVTKIEEMITEMFGWSLQEKESLTIFLMSQRYLLCGTLDKLIWHDYAEIWFHPCCLMPHIRSTSYEYSEGGENMQNIIQWLLNIFTKISPFEMGEIGCTEVLPLIKIKSLTIESIQTKSEAELCNRAWCKLNSFYRATWIWTSTNFITL